MHPAVRQTSPGICPRCGMKLVPVREEKTHDGESPRETFDKHRGHSTSAFRTKFWVSLLFSIPVVFYADVVQNLLNYQAPAFLGSQYVPFLLSSIIFFYGGSVFIVSAFRELGARTPGMMTLIALAITTAYLYSVYAVFIGSDQTLWWELSTLIVIMLLGHWMEMRAVSGAQSALQELSKLLPDTAEVMREGKSVIVPLEDVQVGDVVLVKPGGKVPTDGVVTEGTSDVDESLATGESKPVMKQQGSEVIAGTVNGDGSLTLRVTKIGEGTFLAGVMRLVAEAQASKSKLQLLSDRAAYYLTLIAVVVGSITLITWLRLADPAFAVERMVAVLVIACPHALGLAVPLVASISTTKAARNGFLVKQRLALEAARNLNVVLFDKTGTLTKGAFGVEAVLPAAGEREEYVLALAASVNSHSEHPIAKAIVEAAQLKRVQVPEATGFSRIPGRGASAKVSGSGTVFVGSPRLLTERKIAKDTSFSIHTDDLSKKGNTIVYVMKEKKLIGAIALGDVIRDESRETIRELKTMGLRVAMITGDSDDVASWVANELGVDEYFARVLPQEKSEKVKLLQGRGLRVAMVGDGINDAPALTQADLGVAIGAGTNVAVESAGIILVKNDPRDIAKIIRLSKLTYVKMVQNLLWATGYNIVAIPLAAGVLAFKGIFLQPAVAALFMSLSTVIVALNAILLRGKSLTMKT